MHWHATITRRGERPKENWVDTAPPLDYEPYYQDRAILPAGLAMDVVRFGAYEMEEAFGPEWFALEYEAWIVKHED